MTFLGCPNTICKDVAGAVRLIDLFEKGLPPVSGGMLDQSAWFLEAANILKADENTIQAEKYRE